MKKIIAGLAFFAITAATWAAQTYTFSGASFPTCSSGGWSGDGSAANPYTCSGSGTVTLSNGDSIAPSSSITIVVSKDFILAGNNAIGSSTVPVNLQTLSGDLVVGSGSTIYGNLSSNSGAINLTGTTLIGSINTGGSVSLNGGSVTGSVTSGNKSITTTNGTTIGGDVTANNGSISLSGGSVTGAVHSDCCTVTTNNTNISGGVSSGSNTVSITGGTISGTISISTNGGSGIIINGATVTSGNIVAGSVPVSITNSTIGSAGNTVNVSAQNPITISGSTVYGNVSNTPSSNAITIQNGSTVNGNVSGNNKVTINTGSVVNGNATAGNWNGALVTDSTSFVNGVCSSNTNSVASPGDPQYVQCTGGANNNISAFNAFETSTASTATTGSIYTKLAGSGFSLSVVAISGGAVATTWSGNVNVSLVANTGSTPGSVSCPAGYNTSNALTTVAVTITNGRGTATFSAVNTAYQDVRAYIVSTSQAISCSTDKFAIRPAALTIKALTGTTTLVNSQTSGAPAIKAGSNFTLTASAGAGYLGTPNITTSSITVPSASWTTGVLTGTGGFSTAASGSNSNTASGIFTYSEVGNFNLSANAVYDSGFTVVDQGGDCVLNSTSNMLSSGKYGCNVGSAALNNIGRFFPDHFNVAVTAGCSGGTAYTYSGQPLSKVTVTAQNASNGTTKNYDTGFGFSRAVTLTDVSGASGTLSNNGIAATMFVSGVTSSNNATLVAPTFTFPSPAPSPSVPKTLQMRATENTGGDGVSSLVSVSPSVNYDGSALIRFGRLRLFNAYGAVGTTVNMPMQAQYWSQDGMWVQNGDDSCTTVAAGNVRLVSNSVAVQGGTGTITMSNGAANLPLTTSSTSTVSSGVAINLGTAPSEQSCLSPNGNTTSGSNDPWLRSQNGSTGSCASLSSAQLWQRDPSATASFGIFSPESRRMVHMREAYW